MPSRTRAPLFVQGARACSYGWARGAEVGRFCDNTSDVHGIMERAFAKHVACSRKSGDNKENCACMILVSVCLFCMYVVSVPGQL